MPRANHHDHPDLGHLTAMAVSNAWRWRTEALLLAILLAPFLALESLGTPGMILWAALVISPALEPHARAYLTARLHAARVRRAWTRAVIDSGAADPPPLRSRRPASLTGPRATRVTPTPQGDQLHVRIGRGSTVEALEQHAPIIAANLGAKEVRVTPHPSNAARATVDLVRTDPFHKAEPTAWPNLGHETTSVWDDTPFGNYENGDPVTIPPIDTGHVLIGGVTGSGKSVALQILVAQAALDPTAHLILFDNKKLELGIWAPCADASVDRNITDGVRVLQGLQAVMEQRQDQLYAALLAHDTDRTSSAVRKVTKGMATYTVFIDELAYYLRHPDKDARTQFLDALLDLLQRGRATGIRVIAAMQRPSAELLNTDLRAQFSTRIAFRVMEPETTMMILGTRDAPAHQIPDKGYAGVGYLGGESTRPRRFRTPYLTEDHIRAIAARATTLRAGVEAATLVKPPAPRAPKPLAEDQRAEQNRRTLLAALPSLGDGLTRSEITTAAGKPDRELYPVLQGLLKAGLVERSGGGRKGDPYRYRQLRGQGAHNARTTNPDRTE